MVEEVALGLATAVPVDSLWASSTLKRPTMLFIMRLKMLTLRAESSVEIGARVVRLAGLTGRISSFNELRSTAGTVRSVLGADKVRSSLAAGKLLGAGMLLAAALRRMSSKVCTLSESP